MSDFNFDQVFSPEETAAIHERSHAQILAANAQALDRNAALAWRQALAAACGDERLLYRWYEAEYDDEGDLVSEGFTVVQREGVRVRVPDGALDGLLEHGAEPAAVACMLRAVTFDTRSAWWGADG